jgi:hypothetical protein
VEPANGCYWTDREYKVTQLRYEPTLDENGNYDGVKIIAEKHLARVELAASNPSAPGRLTHFESMDSSSKPIEKATLFRLTKTELENWGKKNFAFYENNLTNKQMRTLGKLALKSKDEPRYLEPKLEDLMDTTGDDDGNKNKSTGGGDENNVRKDQGLVVTQTKDGDDGKMTSGTKENTDESKLNSS